MLKRIAWICLFLTLGIFGIIFYYWSEFTNIPQWYRQEKASVIELENPDNIQASQQQVQTKIASQIQSQIGNEEVEVKLNQEDIDKLLNVAIANNQQDSQLWQATKGVKTKIKDDALEIGTVVNTTELSEQEEKIEQAIEKFPLLKNRDIYIAIEGRPNAVDGQLQFDKNTLIKIGDMSMTIKDTAQRLGVSPEKILQNLTIKSNLIEVQDIEVIDEEIIFKGNKN